MDLEIESQKPTLDLAKNSLKKVPKMEDAQQYKVLILDDNELQKIDNIDSYLKIEKLSLYKNQLLRMYGVCRLHCLRELNLSHNKILTIEGLKDLVYLTHLNLECNKIKTIEHLNTNVNLQYLNLSENSITSVSDMSYLKNLKELFLNGNRISHLRQCDKHLPQSLETLTLAKNNIADLNEICTLSHLNNLNSITIADNPCVQMAGNVIGFDYRPFVLNWCMSVKHIDGFVVTAIESLKAEWLYSQGRGRQFPIGEQTALARYLSSVCPLSGEALENQNERKLRLILSKAQQHQRQLQEQTTLGSDGANQSANNSPSSLRRKGQATRIQSPRVSRLSGRQNSPDAMSNSYHGNLSNNSMSSGHSESSSGGSQLFELTRSLIDNITSDNNIMSQSLDPNMLASSNGSTVSANSSIILGASSGNECIVLSKQHPTVMNQNQGSLYNDQLPNSSVVAGGGPLTAASKMVPVPESLMSPDCGPTTTTAASIVQRNLQHCNAQPQPQTPQIPKAIKTKDSNRAVSQAGGGIPVANVHPKSGSPRTSKRNNSSERSSPSLSPRKTLNSHNSNGGSGSNSHSRPVSSQSKYSVHAAIATPSEGGSSNAVSSDDDSETINIEKLRTIRHKAAQQQTQQNLQHVGHGLGPKAKDKEVPAASKANTTETVDDNKATENSAILIQKLWRGYVTRKRTRDVVEKLFHKRTNDHILQLTKDMQVTKEQLESGRKIQQLQMKALRQLWRKVSSMNPAEQTRATHGNTGQTQTTVTEEDETGECGQLASDGLEGSTIQDLTKSCSMLMNQVQQLQGAVRDIVSCMQFLVHVPPPAQPPLSNATSQQCTSETQTDIVAVVTPQVERLQETFPFGKGFDGSSKDQVGVTGSNKLSRPSTLPISSTETSPKLVVGQGQDTTIDESQENTDMESISGDTQIVRIDEADRGNDEENNDGEQKERDEKEIEIVSKIEDLVTEAVIP
uniref:Centrosomal protein of 97 kDa n=1 Tax=Anopheles minimus TaxID=112268 RepID=A0A182WA80_9DIPT